MNHHTDLVNSFKAGRLGLKKEKGSTWFFFNDRRLGLDYQDFYGRFPYSKMVRISSKERNIDLAKFKLGAYAGIKGEWHFCHTGKEVSTPKRIRNKHIFAIGSWSATELLDLVTPEIKINGSTYVFNIAPAYTSSGNAWCVLYDKVKDDKPNPDIFVANTNANLANAIIGLAEQALDITNINIFNDNPR